MVQGSGLWRRVYLFHNNAELHGKETGQLNGNSNYIGVYVGVILGLNSGHAYNL